MALAFACVSALMVPVSLCGVHEQKLLGRTSFGEYVGATWELMRSQAFFFVEGQSWVTSDLGYGIVGRLTTVHYSAPPRR